MSRFALAIFLLMAGLLNADPVIAKSCSEDYCITAWVVASGGEIESAAADGSWSLSGTIGQWEATSARELRANAWRLTGGFWALSLDEMADLLFRDRFERSSGQQ